MTPAEQNVCLPAEWEPHAATWIAWPHNISDWPGKFQSIRWAYAELIRILGRYEHINVLVNDARAFCEANQTLRRAGINTKEISLHICPTNRSWIRDSGPLILVGKKKRLATLWAFNAWAKYPNFHLDQFVAPTIARWQHIPAHQVLCDGKPVVLEGGAIDVDGQGLLMATEECLLSTDVQIRNPCISKPEMEKILQRNLNAHNVLWLRQGIVGDDTHGHIDDVARFVAPGIAVIGYTDTERDENCRILAENAELLESYGVKLIRIPMPEPVIFDRRRLPASYMNFYIANGVVIVPTFNDKNDYLAVGILTELFPARDVIGVYAGDLIWGLGAWHCATIQEPLAR